MRSAPGGLRIDEARPDEGATLRNLGELYAYDFSEMTGSDLDDGGRFEPDLWSECWGGNRTPFLFRLEGHLAGFAILAVGSRITRDPAVQDVAEFFVLRRYRRQGIGTRAAAALFDLRPGTWEVRERAENLAARAFWHRAIGAYATRGFEELTIDDDTWHGWVQRFESPPHPPGRGRHLMGGQP
jgi:predicted acetyltransferase